MNFINYLIKKQKILILFILFFIISSIASPYFLTYENIINLLFQVSIYGIIACGVTFVTIGGEFDLSVGAMMAMSGVICVQLTNRFGLWTVIPALVLLPPIIGWIYGVLVSKLSISSFIVTLGGMFIYRGLAYLFSGSVPIASQLDNYGIFGTGKLFTVPYPVILFFIVILISEFILAKTKFGRNVFAVGGNLSVAKYTGINTSFYKTMTYIICAFTVILAGLLFSSRLNTANPLDGEDAAMSIYSAVVLGGTSLSGGEGGAIKTLIGVLLLGLITNALNLLGVFSYYQLTIKGLLLISVIFVERYYKSRNKT